MKGLRHLEDVDLVAGALAGSQDACTELVRRYERPIFSLVLRMVKDRSIAEELAQEAFIKAFSALSSYDASRKFSSWLFKIAHNTTIDRMRRRRVATVSLEGTGPDGSDDYTLEIADEEAESPHRRAEIQDLGRDLEAAIAQLRPDYAEVVVLRFQQGLAYNEIAEVTGLALGTVKTHLHRARKQLAELMRGSGWEPEEA